MTQKNYFSRYQLRAAAGLYWLLDMEQSGNDYRRPLPFNETGAYIWKRLADGKRAEEIAFDLHKDYAVEREEAFSDVQQFCRQLVSEGIICEDCQ